MRERESEEGRKEMFYLTTHSTHFIYGYMASDIWLRTILIVRKETRCRHIGYSYRLGTWETIFTCPHTLKFRTRPLAGTASGMASDSVRGRGTYRLAAWVLLYAPSHIQDNTYHSLCYTSRGALAGMRNSSMGPPHEGLIRRPIAP